MKKLLYQKVYQRSFFVLQPNKLYDSFYKKQPASLVAKEATKEACHGTNHATNCTASPAAYCSTKEGTYRADYSAPYSTDAGHHAAAKRCACAATHSSTCKAPGQSFIKFWHTDSSLSSNTCILYEHGLYCLSIINSSNLSSISGISDYYFYKFLWKIFSAHSLRFW